MSEPEWLDVDIVLDIRAEQLALFGGGDGARDRGLLESALARPLNKFAYGEADLAVLAAAYAFGIARNHPFVDGNKRIGFTTAILFLELNGCRFTASEADATLKTLALAAGELNEADYSGWLKANCKRSRV